MMTQIRGNRNRLQMAITTFVVCLFLFLVQTAPPVLSLSKKPNILFILADDAGWADFQSHDPTMRTANIEALKEEGVFLNQSYVYPMCSPSRSALLSGRYPHTYGQQNNAIFGNRPFWLNENFTLLPKALQYQGYRTHMLGKWHLGFCHPGLTPWGRGFDTFYGFLLGAHTSYYTHYKGSNYDWWENDQVDWTAKNHYQTDLLNERAVKIVQDSNPDQPFFMYLSFGAPHGPFEAPEHYIEQFCPHITNRSRQIHCAMMAVLDKGVGEVMDALKKKGTYDNSVILFMSDNGGPIKDGSVNWPLRGGKKTIYEGGTRSYTILKAPRLAETNVTWSGYAHATDWYPTLLEAAGAAETPEPVHGVSLWSSLMSLTSSPRSEFIYNVDDFPKFNHSAYRIGPWKLIWGKPGFVNGWYPPFQLLNQGVPWVDLKIWQFSDSNRQLFNIEQDPEERLNLYNNATSAAVLLDFDKKIEEWTRLYPLQPFYLAPPSKLARNKTTNTFRLCWCRPAGLGECDDPRYQLGYRDSRITASNNNYNYDVTSDTPSKNNIKKSTSNGGSTCFQWNIFLISWILFHALVQ